MDPPSCLYWNTKKKLISKFIRQKIRRALTKIRHKSYFLWLKEEKISRTIFENTYGILAKRREFSRKYQWLTDKAAMSWCNLPHGHSSVGTVGNVLVDSKGKLSKHSMQREAVISIMMAHSSNSPRASTPYLLETMTVPCCTPVKIKTSETRMPRTNWPWNRVLSLGYPGNTVWSQQPLDVQGLPVVRHRCDCKRIIRVL